MTVEPFTVDHYRILAGDQITPEGLRMAIVNQISGPGFTLIDGRQILAVGGIRVQGIGEAWALLGDAARARPKSTLRTARDVIEQSMAHEKLYRVYAEATVDKPAWFKHLGFRQQGNLFVR